jgi:hypothetical protein
MPATEAKPLPKLIVDPVFPITYTLLAMLLVWFAPSCAIALIVIEALTEIGPVYSVEEVVGALPSVV